MIKLSINGQTVECSEGITILQAAREAGIYIPSLCSHPDLLGKEDVKAADVVFQNGTEIKNAGSNKDRKQCGLCLAEIEGISNLINSCAAEVKEGMVVSTDTERVKAQRRENLIPILKRHRHACLTCAQQEGCSRSQCSSNVPENERCCTQFGHCELQDVVNYVGISDNTPKWLPTGLPIAENEPLFVRDYNLCIGCTRCVRICTSIRGVEALGFVYDKNGEVQVGYLKETTADSGCRFCTACVEICPTGALTDKNVRSGKKEEDIVPCKNACPAHANIPQYLRLISQKRYDEANAVIREKIPFPGILGRVCVHPCEQACRRAEIDEPVSICILKRFASDNAKGYWKKSSVQNNDTGKKIAVIGAGPAGLTTAFYLRKKGHSVTIFDAKSKAGGMMRYGIPSYRLPADVLDKEIEEILSLGIEFKPNTIIGKDCTLDALKSKGFEAVFIAVGAQKSKRINIEGVDNKDVLWAAEFLSATAEGKDINLKNKIMVIGGGDVAIDAAMSAKRCGAQEVIVACLEKRQEMPAHLWEIESALAEGIVLKPGWGPNKILTENSVVTGIELIECLSVFDQKGSFAPKFSDKKEIVNIDQVIMSIGQAADISFIDNKADIERGLIVVNADTLKTKSENMFAGGDAADTFGMAVVYAAADGRKAAASIDKELGGDGNIEETLFTVEKHSGFIGKDKDFAFRKRQIPAELDPKTRCKTFDEICTGFEEDQAMREARRCLQCDLRLNIGCNPEPPQNLLSFAKENIEHIAETEGVFQLLDEDHKVLMIKGCANLKEELLIQLEENENAAWFEYEEDKMYSQRESELIQKYLQEHGEMPGGDEDDDLF